MPKSVLSKPYQNRIAMFQEYSRGKTVLHLGCSSGGFLQERLARGDLLHSLLNDVASELHGIDIHEESIEMLRDIGFNNLYIADVQDGKIDINKQFDMIVAGDILEHITKPGCMLEAMKPLLKPDGKLLLSTNNAFGLNYQIRRWLGIYTEHPEHVAFYSPETLRHLFERHEYTVDAVFGAYTVPPYTLKKKLLFIFGRPLYKQFPVLAGTLVIVARNRNEK